MKKYLKCLLGFPIGNCILLLTYILVCLIDGEARFQEEFSKLLEFRYFIAQVVFSGIVYVIIYEAVQVLTEFSKKEKGVTWGDLFKFLGGYLVIIVVGLLLSDLINRRGSLQEYVGDVFIGISTLVLILAVIVYIIYNAVQNRKINKALIAKQASGKKK